MELEQPKQISDLNPEELNEIFGDLNPEKLKEFYGYLSPKDLKEIIHSLGGSDEFGEFFKRLGETTPPLERAPYEEMDIDELIRDQEERAQAEQPEQNQMFSIRLNYEVMDTEQLEQIRNPNLEETQAEAYEVVDIKQQERIQKTEAYEVIDIDQRKRIQNLDSEEIQKEDYEDIDLEQQQQEQYVKVDLKQLKQIQEREMDLEQMVNVGKLRHNETEKEPEPLEERRAKGKATYNKDPVDNNEDDDDMFEPTSDCCIYKVPRDLRKLNEEAYTPQMVSIGPLHHHVDHLSEMNKTKSIYVKKFTKRTSVDVVNEFERYITSQQKRIHACYAVSYSQHELVNIILNDVIFIFELFLRNYEAKSRSVFDFLLDTPKLKAAVKQDLQLLENQIPYFVFQELFMQLGDSIGPSADGGRYRDPFLILALRFFYDDNDPDENIYSSRNIRHFTDLRRCFMLKDFRPPKGKPDKHIKGLRCATKLQASGVKFKKCFNENPSSIQVSCEYIKRPLKSFPFIKFEQLELQIPCIEVDDKMECLVRNLMAFEQLHYPWETHICNFIFLLDFLIDTENDVELLVEKEILVNLVGDNATVANIFNKLGSQGIPSYSCYYDSGEKLKAHYRKSWNHIKAGLINVYFNDFWIGLGTIAAVLLLVFTLVQTVCSILQVL